MSQEKLTNLATDEIVTRLVKRFEEGDNNVGHSVMVAENEILEALPKILTGNDSETLLNLMRGMGFNLNSLNPTYAIFGKDDQSFNIFQLPLIESLKTFATFPRDFSKSTRNLTWNRRADGSELLTVTSLLGDQIYSARYETRVDPSLKDDIFSLTQLDMSETANNSIKADRYPVTYAGIIPMNMLTKAYSGDVKRIFDAKKPDNPDLVLKPNFIPHVLNPKA